MAAPVATQLTADPAVNTTNNTTIALTSTVDAPADKTIVALVANSNSRTLSTFADGANTYVEAVEVAGATIAHVLDALVRAAGATFTATFAGGNADRKALAVFTLDAECTNEGSGQSSGNSNQPSASTPSVPADCRVLACAIISRQDGSFSMPSGWSVIDEIGISSNRDFVVAEFATTGAGVVTFNPTYSGGSAAWACAISAYKAVGSSNQNISGSLFTDTPTFFSATITRGAVAIAGALFTAAQTFFGGRIANLIRGSLLTNAQTFFAGSVTVGVRVISGALFTAPVTFFSGVVSGGAAAIIGSLFTNTPTFFAGKITSHISGTLFTNTPQFFAGAVSLEQTLITGSLFTNQPVFFGGEVTGGADNDNGTFLVPYRRRRRA